MKKTNFLLITSVFFIFLFNLISVYATEYSGDGIHVLETGDFVILDNGWKIEILGVFKVQNFAQINFRIYDLNNNSYPSDPFENIWNTAESPKKFGNDSILKMNIKYLELLGNKTNTASPMVTMYEKVKLDIQSIDEMLPGVINNVNDNSEDIEEVNKILTYKGAKEISLNVGEEIILGNKYVFKFNGFHQNIKTPIFSILDSKRNLIDEYIIIGKGVYGSFGSLIYISDFDEDSVDLKIIDGSNLVFGTGWNLFSISLEDGDGFGTILESTCNNASLWIWNNQINDYDKIGFLEEGQKIPANKGIWAKIQTKKDTTSDIDCEIIVSGTKSVSTQGQKLNAGWNLIGAPITAYGGLKFADVLGDCEIEKGPWQFINTTFTSFKVVQEFADKGKFSSPFADNLHLNRGYFIKVKKDCILGDFK